MDLGSAKRIVDHINAAKPDIVWVGLAAPKQEKWMAKHLGRIRATAMIGVGAAFDFHSGNVKWTPAWIRKIGMQWVYRLAFEPKRIWRRNLDSPRFILAVLRQPLSNLVRQTSETGSMAGDENRATINSTQTRSALDKPRTS